MIFRSFIQINNSMFHLQLCDHSRVLKPQGRPDLALAAIFIGDLGAGADAVATIVKRGDQVGIFLGDDVAANLAGAGHLTVIGVQFAHAGPAADLAARQHRIGGDGFVHRLDMLADGVIDLRMAGQFLIAGIGDVVAFGPVPTAVGSILMKGITIQRVGRSGNE